MASFPLSFGTQSSPGRHGFDDGPRHINGFLEEVPEGEPAFPFYATEGLTRFTTIAGGSGGCRGLVGTDSFLFAVVGTQVVRIDITGSESVLGAIPGTDDVSMAANGATPEQIAVVADAGKYRIESNAITRIADPDLPPANAVTVLDQRAVYAIPDGRFFWSDIDAVQNIDALSFATAEGAPDGLVTCFAHRLDLYLPGTTTTEIWRSTGDADAPFARVSGGYLPHGCAASKSITAVGDSLFWVTDKYEVIEAVGYQARVISHAAVSRAIASIADKSCIVAFPYYVGGTGFYCLTCTSWTWVYNTATGRWFERQSIRRPNWRARHSAFYRGNWYVGDDTSPRIYRLDQGVYTEDLNLTVMALRSPPVHAFPNRVSVDRLHLDLVTGVGLNSTDPDESNPSVAMRYSDDGGRNWSRELTRSLGVDADHQTRVTFNGLGVTGRHGRIFEIRMSAPVVRALRHASIEGDLIGT